MLEPKLKEGVRLIGLAMSQVVWSGVWAHIYVDCQHCDQSIGLLFDNNNDADAFTDQEFLKLCSDKGWNVNPGNWIRCPKCNIIHL